VILIGLAKEIKLGEFRVALSPVGVQELIKAGSNVIVETGAGHGVGYDDMDYASVGGHIVNRMDLFNDSDIIVKVKEPQQSEIELLSENQIVFSYLHLAPDKKQADGLLSKKIIGIAFETVTDSDGGLPLLASMSQVAGRLAIQQGMYFLTRPQGGSGVLLSGVPGTDVGKVLIIGGGTVGTSAAMIAHGLRANVVILDQSMKRLRQLEHIFGSGLTLLHATSGNIEKHIANSDLVIGAVLLAGAIAPKVVTKKMLRTMKSGSVIVDVSIDQGGCFETSRATTHNDPVYSLDGITHYCVANMPSAVSRTSSAALEASILPYLLKLAKDPIKAMIDDVHLRNGLNVYQGKVTHKAVAESLGYKHYSAEKLLLM